METTTRNFIKGRTILTRFKENERLLLEVLAEEYGMDYEQFAQLLKKEVGKRNFAEVQKKNEKRKKRKTSKEDATMKARISKENAGISSFAENECKYNLTEHLKMKQLFSETSNNMQDKLPAFETTVSKTTIETATNEGGNTMVEEVLTKPIDHLDELHETKKKLESYIKDEESTIESYTLSMNKARDEVIKIEAEIEEIQNKLDEVKGSLDNKTKEIEELSHNITASEKKVNTYKEQLATVERQIEVSMVIYLVAPGYKSRALPKKGRFISTVTRKGYENVVEVVEMPHYKINISVDEMEELGYSDSNKYRQAYAFAMLTKQHIDAGENVIVLTNKESKLNTILDRVVGKGEWVHN